MAFASMDNGNDDTPLAEINMVPLIDVMLVLLIIFMVTAPLLTHAVKVDLPKATSTPNRTPPEAIQLSIDASQQVFWNGERVDAGQLQERFRTAASQTRASEPPELHIRAERNTPYERIAQVMSDAARQGLTRIGFVTDPNERAR
ncbi:ExbD/TolR family protein [Propionivibrio soli]|uniref:ExbD/TolR family protein n=1 Tax=Propionivibrio soli TaxID=2976531 RepID=UPI0021E79697|nr:biopolymer transporter ExbD [Propionivibrio soli]